MLRLLGRVIAISDHKDSALHQLSGKLCQMYKICLCNFSLEFTKEQPSCFYFISSNNCYGDMVFVNLCTYYIIFTIFLSTNDRLTDSVSKPLTLYSKQFKLENSMSIE